MNDAGLPSFSLDAYRALLKGLQENGFAPGPVSRMAEHVTESRAAYLRHDVDLDPVLALPMARLEQQCGYQATYYLPLTLPFNLLHPPCSDAVLELAALGHEIGLHYDMETYPRDVQAARQHLDREAALLREIAGKPVRTITMHNPHKGEGDPFRNLQDYLHPHADHFQDGLCYISDSCRAWRDETLLTCLGPEPPARLLLNTHPELWLDGSVTDRLPYLDQVLRAQARQRVDEYYDRQVAKIWKNHPGARQHDAREQSRDY